MDVIAVFSERLGKVLLLHCINSIFKKTLDEGKVPTAWKDTSVMALHKNGDKTLASNYQSVCLTSVICKMMEY